MASFWNYELTVTHESSSDSQCSLLVKSKYPETSQNLKNTEKSPIQNPDNKDILTLIKQLATD